MQNTRNFFYLIISVLQISFLSCALSNFIADTIDSQNTQPNLPPLAPILESPNGNLEPNTSITLLWKESKDPDGDGILYHVLVDTVDPPQNELAAISETYFVCRGLQENIQYYWQIASYDNHGGNKKSVTWKFKISKEPINTFVLPPTITVQQTPSSVMPTGTQTVPASMQPSVTQTTATPTPPVTVSAFPTVTVQQTPSSVLPTSTQTVPASMQPSVTQTAATPTPYPTNTYSAQPTLTPSLMPTGFGLQNGDFNVLNFNNWSGRYTAYSDVVSYLNNTEGDFVPQWVLGLEDPENIADYGPIGFDIALDSGSNYIFHVRDTGNESPSVHYTEISQALLYQVLEQDRLKLRAKINNWQGPAMTMEYKAPLCISVKNLGQWYLLYAIVEENSSLPGTLNYSETNGWWNLDLPLFGVQSVITNTQSTQIQIGAETVLEGIKLQFYGYTYTVMIDTIAIGP